MYADTLFIQIVKHVLEREGVLSDHPNDNGGITKYGITRPFLSQHLGREATREDIIALSRQDAIEAYRSVLWVGGGIKNIPGPLIQEALFDFAVHSGIVRAVKTLQELVSSPNQDGIIDPYTIDAVDDLLTLKGEVAIANALWIKRGEFLMRLVQKDPTQLPFLLGWYRRIVGSLVLES